MALEIERKFLVRGDSWRDARAGQQISQGYLASGPDAIVRVRRIGPRGFITVKGKGRGPVRSEYEYEVSARDADEMLESLCRHPLIKKTRFFHTIDDIHWVIDEYHESNAGLVVAEAELENPTQPLTLPSWAGPEITNDPRFGNSHLAYHPVSTWRTGSVLPG
jgi:adenylate cyclase